MKVTDFNYDLPEELIAQTPIKDRDRSRLLKLNKQTGEFEHGTFCDILDYMDEGDVLVLNNSKVIPSRIFGVKENTGAVVEFMLLSQREGDVWESLVKPGKKARIGDKFVFGEGRLKGEVIDIIEEGIRLVKFTYDGVFLEILDEIGNMPLPPYIHEKLEDKDRYQTVYAVDPGSAAAPTAGLHFTKELLDKVEKKGVKICYVTLHVGLGTFRPVKEENVEEHPMHSEWYSVSNDVADTVNNAKMNGHRIISVGTTSCRTLEAATDDNGILHSVSASTNIFIYPGYKFKSVDRLITNFHLPESTLIMLVSALAGRENILRAYNEAVKEKYRFFSFGDAMILY
ncbi:MAG: tRNA preQ1(34) S-adenosylmethionine ribosyltransferase-isomerase QueA [Clostridia bacterium]|nr:tRNA preQ1(34) S-adenosylmethionine ribosyltransferase-isomerase QueA [Clostridia bacterium]